MGKYFLLVLMLSSSIITIAQPTLTATTTNPLVGESYVTVPADRAPMPGNAGANQTWDFSTVGIGAIDQIATTYESCSVANDCLVFSGTTIVGREDRGKVNYFSNTGTKMSVNGFVRTGGDACIYDDPREILHYPFTYGTTYKDSFACNIINSNSFYHYSGEITVTGDAYGTLKTPTGTFTNVLRVHTYEQSHDSNVIGSVTQLMYYQSDIYTWFSPNSKTSLFTITNTIDTSPTPILNYYSSEATYNADEKIIPAKVAGINNTEAAFSIYPNSVTDLLNVKFSTTDNEKVRVSIIDVMGREIAQVSNATYYNGAHTVSYNTSKFPKGLYLVRLQGNNSIVTKRVEIL